MVVNNLNVILLAAGLSRRMGSINKLLLEINGQPLVRHMAQLYLSLGVTKLIVVTGFEHHKVADALQGLPLQLVHNLDYASGQKSSMRTAIDHLSADCRCVFVALADQPLLELADLSYLLAAFESQTKPILIPYYQGQRGNPILLSQTEILRVDCAGQHLGCRKLIEKNPRAVHALNVLNHHFTTDIDTPEDVAALNTQRSQASMLHQNTQLTENKVSL